MNVTQRLTFKQYGTGPEIWLAFHGIGQDATAFLPFGKRLADTHTIYSINLPFHGQAAQAGTLTGKNADDEWPDSITKEHWQSLLRQFLAEQQIERFSLIGFSMGGRFAMITAETVVQQLNELILLAPDGITNDIWFKLATGTSVGRAALRYFLSRNRTFRQVGRLLVSMGVLAPSRLRFAESALQTPAQCRQVYRAWTGFRQLNVNVPALARLLNDHHVPVTLVLGEHDTVLPKRYIRPLTRLLLHAEQIILPTGHSSLIRRAAERWPAEVSKAM